MKTILKTDGVTTSFVFAEVEPIYHDALRHLAYQPTADGFAKHFPAGTPDIERIYEHFARCAPACVRQAARIDPMPWQDTLQHFLTRIESHAVNWYLVGSAALAVRGIDVCPGDIDIVTDDDGAERLNELLQDHLLEPPQRPQGWICNTFARAFVSGLLEWVGGVNASADRPAPSDFGPTAASRLEVVTWRGVPIRVPPLDLQLAVSERRKMPDRADQIRRHLSAVR